MGRAKWKVFHCATWNGRESEEVEQIGDGMDGDMPCRGYGGLRVGLVERQVLLRPSALAGLKKVLPREGGDQSRSSRSAMVWTVTCPVEDTAGCGLAWWSGRFF